MSSGIYVYLSIQWMLHHVPLKAKLDNCTAVCVECFWYTTHLILFFFWSLSHTSNRKQNKARNWYLFTLHTRLHSPKKCSSRFLNNYETFDWKLPHYYVFFTNGRTLTYFKEAAPPPSQKQKIVPWKKDKKNTIIYNIYTPALHCVFVLTSSLSLKAQQLLLRNSIKAMRSQPLPLCAARSAASTATAAAL